MEPWQTILLALGGNTALLAVLGWLTKSIVHQQLSRDIEQFKATLAADTSAVTERLKHELQLATVEHQIRFSRLHERRAEVTSELYSLLIEALWEAESFLLPAEFVGEPTQSEKYVSARNKLVELYRYFDRHRIYLPPELCQSLQELHNTVRGLVASYGMWLQHGDESFPEHALQQKHEALTRGWNAIKNEVPQARQVLEDEFRVLLGAIGPPMQRP